MLIPNYSDYSISESLDITNNKTWYILKPYIAKSGHITYWLYKNKVRKTIWLHNIMAEIYYGPVPIWYEVCHNDWNPQNNKKSNLRYDTRSNNLKDRTRHWFISEFTINHPKPGLGKFWWDHPTSKKIWQFDFKWNLIKIWNAWSEIRSTLWFNPTHISSVCKWNRKQANWFNWSYIL